MIPFLLLQFPSRNRLMGVTHNLINIPSTSLPSPPLINRAIKCVAYYVQVSVVASPKVFITLGWRCLLRWGCIHNPLGTVSLASDGKFCIHPNASHRPSRGGVSEWVQIGTYFNLCSCSSSFKQKKGNTKLDCCILIIIIIVISIVNGRSTQSDLNQATRDEGQFIVSADTNWDKLNISSEENPFPRVDH